MSSSPLPGPAPSSQVPSSDPGRDKLLPEIGQILADNAPDGIYIINEDRFEYVNPAFEAITGYSLQEILDRPLRFLDLVAAEDHDRALEQRAARLRGEPISPLFEFHLKTKHGPYKHVEINSVVLPGPSVRVLGILRDFTDRMRVQDELTRTLNILRKTTGAMIQAMDRIVEMRDPFTAGHQRRVADLARAIARELGFRAEAMDGIRIAALIHDIGKISVPGEILSKPGRLSSMEFNIIKSHPRFGFEIMRAIDFPWPVASIILQHHERLNGSGYPSGLVHDDIMLEARIIGVADVVEAMSSHRPYRPALNLDLALDEIRINTGVLYDPRVVDACVRLFEENDFHFREEPGVVEIEV